ncbi:metallophosphoesterase family protein [Planococcus sp. CAU13]|uniref:metallophosphoesterase family protein n=1 Tax=Planococcus sp. CAU13 TaxID=1541197 RepID=UPI00052FE83A|nr:metallophosphoesterase family protein [Planococcus sp. CAU13]
MERLFVISDIHGCADHFKQLLKKIHYRPNVDRLILLGDYIDRGPKSMETLEMILHMVKNEKVIALRGNHDQRFIKLLETKDTKTYEEFLKYGGLETLKSYFPDFNNESIGDIVTFINKEYPSHIQFLKNTPLYHEEQHFIFVHAGLDPLFENWKEQPSINFLYIRDSFIYHEVSVGKKVIFGHTKTSDIHNSADIWFSKDKIGIDGGCAFKQQLNCLQIVDESEFKQHHVHYKDLDQFI